MFTSPSSVCMMPTFRTEYSCFGKFEVRHKEGKMRRILLTGKGQMTADKRKVKFIPLARLLELEHNHVE